MRWTTFELGSLDESIASAYATSSRAHSRAMSDGIPKHAARRPMSTST
jgi:hypothetical protein